MDHSESRYLNTAVRMDEALLRILAVKDIDDISITEVCKEAGVNRSTFYLHYGNVNDLMEEAIKLVDTRFFEYFDEVSGDFFKKMKSSSVKDLILITPDYLDPFLKYIVENRAIVENAFFRPHNMRSMERYNDLFRCLIEPIMEKFNVPEKDKPYRSSYYINGIMAIIGEWIKNDLNESPEYIRDMIIKCVLPPELNL